MLKVKLLQYEGWILERFIMSNTTNCLLSPSKTCCSAPAGSNFRQDFFTKDSGRHFAYSKVY